MMIPFSVYRKTDSGKGSSATLTHIGDFASIKATVPARQRIRVEGQGGVPLVYCGNVLLKEGVHLQK